MSVMYIVGPESCQISVDEPWSLIIALYIREIIGISGLTAPEIPVLEPSSKIWPAWAPRPSDGMVELPDPFNGLVNREQSAREWARWWRHALAVGPAAADDLRPPRFLAFSGTPSLRTLLQLYFERANLWTESISADPLVKRAHSAPRDGLEEIARQAERGWKGKPFKLRLTVIPVMSEHAWQIAPDHILLTRRLIADRENVLDWLRARMLAPGADLSRS
jgi:hypothetical protein